eukprot:Skav222655  [mRNA]  locus=scaffold997:231312:234928:- [translate_table: standard]
MGRRWSHCGHDRWPRVVRRAVYRLDQQDRIVEALRGCCGVIQDEFEQSVVPLPPLVTPKVEPGERELDSSGPPGVAPPDTTVEPPAKEAGTSEGATATPLAKEEPENKEHEKRKSKKNKDGKKKKRRGSESPREHAEPAAASSSRPDRKHDDRVKRERSRARDVTDERRAKRETYREEEESSREAERDRQRREYVEEHRASNPPRTRDEESEDESEEPPALGGVPVRGSVGDHFRLREAHTSSAIRPPEPDRPPRRHEEPRHPRERRSPPGHQRDGRGRGRDNRGGRSSPPKKNKGKKHRERGRLWQQGWRLRQKQR